MAPRARIVQSLLEKISRTIFRSRTRLVAITTTPPPRYTGRLVAMGSYHYGQINIMRTIRLVSTAAIVDGKHWYAINGVSHVDPETPIKLAQYYGVEDKVFKYDLIKVEYIAPTGNEKITIAPNVVNATYLNFVEIILENHEKSVQSWHLGWIRLLCCCSIPDRIMIDYLN
ncbi:hypothetical protein RND71_025795 [Anisodus tanguticus]|uniref:Uncharacterized protein n=1 Tax=Anisodus tanguticus TaxID=243964 RepID=A0AAE1RM93_9SOLA|nr:hypothetical protein RND71_025795 [Anisodus tanguticus]